MRSIYQSVKIVHWLKFSVGSLWGAFAVGPRSVHWGAMSRNSYFATSSWSCFHGTQSKFVSGDHLYCGLKYTKKGLQCPHILQCIMGPVVHTQQLPDQSLLLEVLQVAAPEYFLSQAQSVDAA